MDTGFKDKVVVITGGTTNIGQAAAYAFAREGSKVAVCGRNTKKIEEFTATAKENGLDIFCRPCRIGDPIEEKAFPEAVEDVYGGIDVWMKSAAALPSKMRISPRQPWLPCKYLSESSASTGSSWLSPGKKHLYDNF
jgi:NAD(P)-dependent dehydrogenase (short-subunit alcohol dehydrogenase family)